MVMRRAMSDIQRTLMLVKPDGVSRGLVGKVLTRFEDKGFRLPAIKMVEPNETLIRQHYVEHVQMPYYPYIKQSMMMGPILACVVEGYKAIPVCRKMLGATRPDEAEPGTIRFDMAQCTGRNICHASDSLEAAEREIKLWFNETEITVQKHVNDELFNSQ